MAHYFTADLHLGETRLNLMNRPFTSVEEHDNTIIQNLNNFVKPGDMLFVVGDAVSKSATDPKSSLMLLDSINCTKMLFRGNHDEQFTLDELYKYFSFVMPHGCPLDFKLYNEGEDLEVRSVHYPTLSSSHYFNIVGHIHSAWKVQKNMLNVGLDVNHFQPFTVKDIFFMKNALCNFYDDDVWVGDHEANLIHHNRGKHGSYFVADHNNTVRSPLA